MSVTTRKHYAAVCVACSEQGFHFIAAHVQTASHYLKRARRSMIKDKDFIQGYKLHGV